MGDPQGRTVLSGVLGPNARRAVPETAKHTARQGNVELIAGRAHRSGRTQGVLPHRGQERSVGQQKAG